MVFPSMVREERDERRYATGRPRQSSGPPSLRVTAYGLVLIADQYPPFRLTQ
jgi:hypothetical protein